MWIKCIIKCCNVTALSFIYKFVKKLKTEKILFMDEHKKLMNNYDIIAMQIYFFAVIIRHRHVMLESQTL